MITFLKFSVAAASVYVAYWILSNQKIIQLHKSKWWLELGDKMIGRIWNVVSVGFTLWTIMNTLKKMEESKSQLVDEFYSTLSPEEQKLFKNIFGNPGASPEIQTFSLPQVSVPQKTVEVIAPTQVQMVEAQI